MNNQYNDWGDSLYATFLYALVRAWLVVISTLLAFARLSTCNTSVETLAVLLLALGLFAVTSLELFQAVQAELIFLLNRLLCFFD